MEIQEEFEKTGNWLFRWRSYLPLALIPLFLLAMEKYHYLNNSETSDNFWELLCLLISFIGFGIRVWTVGCAPIRTSGRNTRSQIADTLNTTGMYSLVRHPLYLGNFLMILGIVLFTRHLWLMLIYILLFVLYYERIIFTEEAFLKRKFGNDFIVWAKKTPAFIPKFKNYRPPAHKFNWKKALKTEYNGFAALLLSMFALELYGDWLIKHKIDLDLHWIILVGIAVFTWIMVRFLKKYTRVLDISKK
jgi:protein-S-isoprenylcysteine O-methyltransferase Ste14